MEDLANVKILGFRYGKTRGTVWNSMERVVHRFGEITIVSHVCRCRKKGDGPAFSHGTPQMMVREGIAETEADVFGNSDYLRRWSLVGGFIRHNCTGLPCT